MGGVFVCTSKSMKSEARQHPPHQLIFCAYFHESYKKAEKDLAVTQKPFTFATQLQKEYQ